MTTLHSRNNSQDNSRNVVNGIFQELELPGAASGILSGLTFAAKDLFAVSGHVTGSGNPKWLATHKPETATASAIEKVLASGATLKAKAICDELAFSLDGINKHYGTPLNPQLPDCLPGGSSSGSASVVAANLFDFSLGTDTAGSVRVPASYCGIFGIRPTHGSVAMDGIVPLSASYDTVGWFTRRAVLLKDLGHILLDDYERDMSAKKLLIAEEPLELLDPSLRLAITSAIEKMQKHFPFTAYERLSNIKIADWPKAYNQHKGFEVWQTHGQWINECQPDFGQNIQTNFDYAKSVSQKDSQSAFAAVTKMKDSVQLLLRQNSVLCLPTTHALPPKKSATWEELALNRKNLIKFSCISPVGGLAELTMPIAISNQVSVGLSLIASRGSDMMLLELACQLAEELLPL